MTLAHGCTNIDPGSGTGTDADTDPPATSDPTTTIDPDSSSSDPSTTTTTPPDDDDVMTTVPEPVCGNGVREDPEQCDDGNLEAGDGCEPDCTSSTDTQIWEDVQGGDASVQDSALGVAVDAAGNVVVTGYEVDAVGDANVWVQGYGSDGTPGLSVTLDPSGGGNDRGYAIALDEGGNIYLAGSTASEKDASDLWFAKLDPRGAMLWQQIISGPETGTDEARAIAVRGDTVAVAGFVRTGNGDNDVWVSARSVDDGVELWTDVVAGPDGLDDRANGVAIDPDGNVVIAGYFASEGFNTDVWLRKYDPTGVELWTTQYDNPNGTEERGYGVTLTPQGMIAVAGTTPSPVNNEDIWYGKFEPDAGELTLQQKFVGPAVLDDVGLAIAADSEDAVVVVGFKGVAEGDTDIWMRKWDATGGVVWTQNVAGAAGDNDRATAVAIDGNDDVLVVGERRDAGGNDGDVWVAKYAGE